MLDILLFAILPYLAIVLLITGTILRFNDGARISSLSSQFLENEGLFWGSTPWHVGILIIFLGHLLMFVVPSLFLNLSGCTTSLVEVTGLSAAFIALAGLTVLSLRRLKSKTILKVSNLMDFVILGLLIAQMVLGILVALNYRWGSLWSAHTVTPYLWSILKLAPVYEIMSDMPWIIKAHVSLAFILIALLPYSRLIHLFTIPLPYFLRTSPQLVIFNKK